MKRTFYIVLLLLAGCCTVTAQTSPGSERYSDLIARTEGLPAYEALYHMLNYQRFHPEHAPIYYRMGDEVYTLLPTKDALHNYEERAELLYKARLFYGNCLHFLDGKMPHGETFPSITPAGKRLEYSDIDTYIRARLDTISRWRTETDTLHDRFYRMVDRYESCRQLFMQFMEKYPSEKLAHLCLTKYDYECLEKLMTLTRQFDEDKRLFSEALHVSPVPHYNPQFRSVSITMYRLDGVTPSDFLANDIPLWDYAEWIESFMKEQQDTYHKLMQSIVAEYTMIEQNAVRFHQGQTVQFQLDRRLPFRIERYDFHSPMATFIRLQHLLAETILQAADSLTTAEQITDDELSARITALLELQKSYEEANTLLRTMQQQVNEATASKYAYFLRKTKVLTVDRLLSKATQMVELQQNLTRQIDEQLQNYANAYPKQFEDVDISDDKAASDAAEAAAK